MGVHAIINVIKLIYRDYPAKTGARHKLWACKKCFWWKIFWWGKFIFWLKNERILMKHKEFRTYLAIILMRTELRQKWFHGKGKMGAKITFPLPKPLQNSSGDAPILSPGAPGSECPQVSPSLAALCVPCHHGHPARATWAQGRWPQPWRGFHGQSQRGEHTPSLEFPSRAGLGGALVAVPARVPALIPTRSPQKAQEQLRGISVLWFWGLLSYFSSLFLSLPSALKITAHKQKKKTQKILKMAPALRLHKINPGSFALFPLLFNFRTSWISTTGGFF